MMSLARHFTAITALVVGLAAAPVHGRFSQDAGVVTCTNPFSGASWTLRIDYRGMRVDDNPAQISGARVSWHDARDGGNYALDRRSGELTVIMPSSTGGYFLHDHCRPRP